NSYHQKSEIEFINAYFSNTWVKGFKDSHLKFERAYRSGSQIGDFFHMACARAASVENDLLFGGNLKDLKAEVLDFKKFVFQTRAIEMQLVLDSVYETALFFTEKTLDNQLNSVVYVDQKIDTNVVNYASKHFIHALFVNKMMRAVFLNDFSDELSTLQTAELLLDESKGMQHSIWHHFYAVIIEENIDLARKNRRRHLSVLRKAAQFNPSNYQVLFDIANLFCHVKNKSQSQLIEELFKITRSNDIDKYVHLKAFCLEKLGRALYRSQEQESFKKVLIEAIEAYELWGAHRFSERLEQEFNLNGISEKPDISEKATLRNNNVDTHITLDNILKASRAISEEIQMDGLVNKVMKVIVQQAVATSAYLILIENSKPVLYAKSVNNHVETMMRLPLTEDALIDQYPIGIINYVMRTAKTIIIDKAIKSELFSSDAFVNATGTKSIYCQPLMLQNQIIGIIFLGNNISENQFKKESFQALDLMSAQMAISINNSMSFERMEETVRQRTAELVIQKEIIEIKNKEISESIQYGRIIQEAIMPNIDALSEYFEGHFIMAKAKDVLSGDFFWSKSIDDVLIFAIADCTGHGVPAALLSLVCLNALNKSVHENNTIDPGEILNYTSQFIEETFEKTKGHSIQDGMDISLCVFDRNTNELKYAGANMPLYIIQPEDDIINGNQLIAEIKGDKQPVGPYFKRNPFTTKSYKLRKKDVLILASDGFADQFGGPNNKKLKQKGFKNLLIRLNIQDFNNQGKWLSEEFEAWKQEEFQVDDVTILGVLV
ncbi:MAG: SpoIIE family protein phosphatase, partial [Bacteroidetes bacterium]|nr:SpoIIE family protein phosphatase [Bacteroidota bacterium]